MYILHYTGVDVSRMETDEMWELYDEAKYIRKLKVSELQEAIAPFLAK